MMKTMIKDMMKEIAITFVLTYLVWFVFTIPVMIGLGYIDIPFMLVLAAIMTTPTAILAYVIYLIQEHIEHNKERKEIIKRYDDEGIIIVKL